jgi:hypothetical protein
MTLPVRRGTSGRAAERRFPGWAQDPLKESDDLFGRIGEPAGIHGREPWHP